MREPVVAPVTPADRDDLQLEVERLGAELERYRAALLRIQARRVNPVTLGSAPSCYDNAQARAWLVGFESGHAALAGVLAPFEGEFRAFKAPARPA
jgi:hypothetical protein